MLGAIVELKEHLTRRPGDNNFVFIGCKYQRGGCSAERSWLNRDIVFFVEGLLVPSFREAIPLDATADDFAIQPLLSLLVEPVVPPDTAECVPTLSNQSPCLYLNLNNDEHCA